MKIIIVFVLFACTYIAKAQKVSQEEIRKKQEEARRANDELQKFHTTNFSIQKPVTFIPEYQDEIAVKFDISISQFIDFHEFLDSRKAAQIPFLYKELGNVKDIDIPHYKNISKKGYPYYGKILIKLKDSKGNEFDSYGYIYDTEKTFDGVDDYVYRDFKATVTPTSTTNSYDIYCDGKKITSKQFTTTQRNITNFESKIEGMSLLGTLLQTFAVAYIENSEIEGFEGELFKIAQQRTCFYEEDPSKKTKSNSLIYLKEAQIAFEKNEFHEAIRKLDASIWAENNFEALELRGEIFRRFNSLPNTFKDFLTAIQLAKDTNKDKLKIIYRKLAILLASLNQTTDLKMDNNKVLTLFPESAIVYLKKSADYGDDVSKKLLEATDEKDILEKIKNIK